MISLIKAPLQERLMASHAWQQNALYIAQEHEIETPFSTICGRREFEKNCVKVFMMIVLRSQFMPVWRDFNFE
jgi:hypothetical protein